MSARARAALGVFAAAFLLYLATMPGALAPYRDAGEFAVAAHTLGVAHPPSYPLYAVVGRAFDALPAATTAYRLNLLSALCAAGAAGALAWAAGSVPAGLVAGLAFALGAVPWSTAIVQEMYALMALAAALLLAGGGVLSESWRPRLFSGLCFAYGAALTNRTDLVLWAPGLLLLGWPPPERRARALAAGALWGLAGLTVYLFLPLRSSTSPWLDWNHPAALENLVGSLTRRGYGGTLDLLSKSYAPGENFAANLAVYGRHLHRDLGLWVLAPALLGAAAWARRDPRRLAGTFLLYAAAGPLFLYMANMPPNPHALAIVEPHYLLSDLVLCLWAGAGAAELSRLAGGAAWPAWALAALTAAAPLAQGRFARMDRRWDLFAHDWADAALKSVPPGSVLVAKKDVQIFSLWHHQKVLGRRPDVVAYAQGLAHSPWHQEALRRSGALVRPGALRSKEDWEAFVAANPGTFVTMDAELPPGVPVGPPRGLAAPVPPRPVRGADPAPHLALRGDARYEERPDFFSADLVESWAAARQRRGAALLAAGDAAGARREVLGAWKHKRRSPESADLMGFAALAAGDAAAARDFYEAAARLYDETLALTREYKTLPETVRGIAHAASDSAVNLGVCYEKTGDKARAEAAYRRALSLRPAAARAHFNIAVLHWGADWRKVVAELEAALAADPGYLDAARYLPQARARLAAAGR